jgi:hypothetical protein
MPGILPPGLCVLIPFVAVGCEALGRYLLPFDPIRRGRVFFAQTSAPPFGSAVEGGVTFWPFRSRWRPVPIDRNRAGLSRCLGCQKFERHAAVLYQGNHPMPVQPEQADRQLAQIIPVRADG